MADEAHTAGLPDALPDSIGRFRILGVLGEGAVGRVFEAEQAEPQRRVALKVLRAPLADEQALRRFRNEARILASLNHPGIATVYETGTAEAFGASCPYIAMELVVGQSLDEYVAHSAPSLRARVELLARVCDAVQHAHQKGVVHRDLAPRNILVTADGRPKVLDFGIARFADGDDVTLTQAGAALGTLNYMSPEHFSGDSSRIAARSDVFALGVLLFEALAGRRPFELDGLSPTEAARVVTESVAPRLGTLDERFRGDLETIVAKALATEPERRYSAAAELAADLRRFLDHEPVLARPMTTLYRFRKFARRNRFLVAGLSSTVVALVLGLIGTAIFAVRAGARATEAEDSRLEAQRYAAEMRAAEAEERQAADEAIAARAEARMQADTADAVQNLFLRVLDAARPVRSQGRAVTVREALAVATGEIEGAAFEDPRVEFSILMTLAHLHGLLEDYSTAVDHARAAIRVTDEKIGRESEGYREARVWLAVLYDSMGEHRLAEGLYREVVDASGLSKPGAEVDLYAYVALGHLGKQAHMAGDFERAIELSRQSIAGLREYVEVDPVALTWELHRLSRHYMMVGEHELELEAAREAHELAVEIGFEEFTTPLEIPTQLANALDDNGRAEEAIPLYEQTLAQAEQWYGETDDVLMMRFNLALAQLGAGLTDEALANLHHSFERMRALSPTTNEGLLLVVKGMLDAHGAAGRFEEGLIWMDEQALEIPDVFLGALVRMTRGALLFEVGAYEESFESTRTGFELASQSLPVGHQHLIDGLIVLTYACDRLGRTADLEHYTQLLERHKQAAGILE